MYQTGCRLSLVEGLNGCTCCSFCNGASSSTSGCDEDGGKLNSGSGSGNGWSEISCSSSDVMTGVGGGVTMASAGRIEVSRKAGFLFKVRFNLPF
jgi:hypothetical protein